MADAIDSAVAAAETPAKPVGVRVRVQSGREMVLYVPAEMTERDGLDLIAYISVTLPKELAKAKAPRSPILVPAHVMVGRG